MFGQTVLDVIKVPVIIPGSLEHFQLSVHPVQDLDIRQFMLSHTVMMVVRIDKENHLVLPESLSGDSFYIPGTLNNCFGYNIHDATISFGSKRKQLPIDKMTFVGFPNCPDILETLYIRTNTQTQKWANDPRNYAFVYFTTIKGATVDVVTAFLDKHHILTLTESSAKVRAAFVKDELPNLIAIFDDFEVSFYSSFIYFFSSYFSQANFHTGPSTPPPAAASADASVGTANASETASAAASTANASAAASTANASAAASETPASETAASVATANASASGAVGAANASETAASVATANASASGAVGTANASAAASVGAATGANGQGAQAGTWTPIIDQPLSLRRTPEFVPHSIPTEPTAVEHIEQAIAAFEQKTTAILTQAKDDLATLKRKRHELSLAIQARDATIQDIEARRAAALADAQSYPESKKNRRIVFANDEADEDIAALPVPLLDFNPSFDKIFS